MSDKLEEIEARINEALVDGKLPCPSAFKIARELKVSIGEVGETSNQLEIKISQCQLGCFP